MSISGVLGIPGMEQYRISSVQGNPVSLQPVKRLDENSQSRNNPLVIAQKDQDKYVKDYGAYQQTTSTSVGDFADFLELQKTAASEKDAGAEQQNNGSNSYADYLNDTIGVMGYKTQLRSQLGVETIF